MTLTRKKIISVLLLSVFFIFTFINPVFSFGPATAPGTTRNAAVPSQSINESGLIPDAPKTPPPTESSIANVVAWILYYIATFFSWFVALLIQTLVQVATYNHFLDQQVVINGWGIVRDVANNFFIVILLVIAVGTILRVPNYNRQLLPKLLVMAVLINFSKMFTGILIDFSQVLTLWFAAKINEIGNEGNIILFALGLDKLYRLDVSAIGWTEEIPGIDAAIAIRTMLFALILSVVAVVVVAMIIIILIYRIIMLWFLVILSPLAFLLTTFPKGQQYAGMWWSELARYLVVGPVMLFFLYLSFFSGSVNVGSPSGFSDNPGKIPTAGGADNIENRVKLTTQTSQNLLGLTEMEKPAGIIDFLIIIGLMVGSLVAGQKTGVAGAQWAGKGISTLQKLGKGAALGTAGLAGGAAGLVGAKALQGTMAIPGARRVPILGRMAGEAVDKRKVQLAATNAKTEQARITTRAQALKVDDMSESELRNYATAKTSDTYTKIAATQAMMKQGMFRDDDSANRADNIKLINNAKKMLPPELAATFMDNTKKYNPGLAHDTVYKDDSGQFRTDAFVSDVRTGKVKAHEMIEGLSKLQVTALNTSLKGGGHGNIGEFMLNNVSEKDLGEMNDNLLDEVRDEIWNSANVSHKTWERDKTTNKITDSGKKMRDKFNKITNYNNLDTSFADDELEDKRTFVANNRSDISKKVKVIGDKLIDDVGDVLKIDDFKDRGPVFSKMLADKFQKSIDSVDFTKLSEIDKDDELRKKFQNRLKNGLMSGAALRDSQFNQTNPENNARRRIAEEMYKYSSSKDVERMRGLNPKNNKALFDIASRHISEGTIKNLTASPEGSVMGTALVEKIREDERKGDIKQASRATKLKDI